MNEKTLRLLEFDAVKAEVSSRALSGEAEKIILDSLPQLDPDKTEREKSLVGAVMNRLSYLEGEKPETLPDISQIIEKLEVDGAVLEIDEAYAVGIFIRRAEDFKQWLLKPFRFNTDAAPNSVDPVAEIAGRLPMCGKIGTDIFKILDKDGRLRDLPEFRDIRRRIQSLQREIEAAGSSFAKSDETRRMLQSELPSQRDGRMVIAVKANFRGRIRGIVHEVSSSGQTIFVEPEEVVEKNNDLLIENRRLDAEIRRVLRELTQRIAPGLGDLSVFHNGIIFLETIRAKARYCYEKKFIFASAPGKNGIPQDLILKEARHPLLGRRAVPLDFFMASGTRTVIITGPNTGGKTVALKTIGLLALMNQFGLALPAGDGSVLPEFDGIYADIGDEQSLSQSLSTFSAHMGNIAVIISMSTARSLVLLDELGSGTDPEEGSAIAMAIIDHFIETKTRLVVTTHHGVLKNYGYTREGVENASMEFDSLTLSPTFRIAMGVPGESRALDIAERNNFPGTIVNLARAYLDEERSDVSALIAGLKEKHRELDAAAKDGKREGEKLLEERRRADLKELRLRQRELQIKNDGMGALKKLLLESRKTLENLVREIKEGELTRDKTLKVKEFLSNLEASVLAENADLQREEQIFLTDSESLAGTENRHGEIAVLETGMEVLAGEFRRRGRIIRQGKKKSDTSPAVWIVEIGSLKMSFSETELTPIFQDGKSNPMKNTSWEAELAPNDPVKIELSLLGMRLPDAIEALARQVDAAVLGGLGEFAVVHGKGNGILRKGVHDFLKDDSRIAGFNFSRPEFGGFGRTEVTLK